MIFGFNAEKIRKDFEVFKTGVIYFDNACMSLKPNQVIDKIGEYYKNYPACGGRSQHNLAKKVEEEVMKARHEVAKFINAAEDGEIIFTKNTTESINLVANSLGLEEGDEVVISDKEHNSNLIPWLKLKKDKGIKVIVCESNSDNSFNITNFKECLTPRTKLVSVVHSSNLDGVTNPVEEIIKIAHDNESLVLIDGAQSAPHKEIDIKKMGTDFFAFSGHKMLGPSGTGVLYGKKEALENLNQFIVGGETVVDSTYTDFKPEKVPERFEAGLQDYAGIIGLGEACRYLKKIGLKNIEKHEIKLNILLTELLKGENKIKIIGPKDAEKRGGIFSFNIEGMSVHDIAGILNSSKKIAVRSGAHCVHSWFNSHKLNGSVRVSFYLYNTEEEVKVFAEEIKKIARLGK